MKKSIRKAFILLLALCMTLSLVPITASAAVTGQDAYYLARLKPNPLPKAKESYPAKLKVRVNIPNMMNADLEFKGTVGVNTELTDEEILAILKQAVSAVKSYTSPQSACDDKALAEELTQKLKFKQEDMDHIIENLKTLLDVDSLIPKLKVPNFSDPGGEMAGSGMEFAGDIIEAAEDASGLWEAIKSAGAGKLDGNVGLDDVISMPQLPSVQDIVVNGLKISWEEFQRDQQKCQDIIKLSQANERLSIYNSRVRVLIQEKLKEKGGWRLEISAQDIADLTYNKMPGSKQLWTANIDLKKDDSDLTIISGNYSGVFTLSMDADMGAYDNGYAAWYAKEISKGVAYTVTGNTGITSEIRLAYEIPNCKLNITLPEGKNRHFFEENIPNTALSQTEFTINTDRTVTVKAAVIDQTTIWHVMENNGYYEQGMTVIGNGQTIVHPVDSNMMDWPPNTTGNVTMTLVIDMLGK